MSSASIAVYRIQAACFVGRGDGKLAQRVREFQQLRGLGMLRDNRVGVREGSPYCAPSPWSMQRADSGKKWQKRSGSIRGALYVLFTALIEAVIYRKVDFVRLLLKHGATVDDHLYRGMSVLQYAEKNAEGEDPRGKEILEMIRSAPRMDRGWRKSNETLDIETLWDQGDCT